MTLGQTGDDELNLTVKKVLKWLGILAVIWLVGSLAFVKYIGAWGIVFPSHAHETVPPDIPAEVQAPAILLFTKTNSFRHKEAITAGTVFFESLAKQQGWSLFHTENSAVFNADDLSRFAVVIFHNASGDTLSDDQQLVFQAWLQAGGGWIGVHAAGDGSHTDWPWYVENLLGVNFTAHIMGPQFQTARVSNERPQHRVMQQLPEAWPHEEEWYSWDESPRGKGFTILASIDEESYSPVQKIAGAENDLRMGDHPVIWSRCIGEGRSLYTALGHQAQAYDNAQYTVLLENAIAWAMKTQACQETP
jgi:type 1 glutamine amidotransferase